MKEAVKYIVLAIGSVLNFVAAFLAVSLLIDEKLLQMPLLLILPELSLILFIITFVLFIVWGFKFSNNKPHKKILLATGITLIVSILVFLTSSIVNPMLNRVVYNPVSSQNAAETNRPSNSIPEPTFKYNLISFLWSDNFDYKSLPSVEDDEDGTIHDVYTVTKTDGDDYTLHLEKDKYTNDIITVMLTADKTDSFPEFGLLTTYIATSLDEELNHDDFIERIFKSNQDEEIFSEEFDMFETTYNKVGSFINVTFTIK